MAKNKKVTIQVEDDHHLWAIMRAMYDKAAQEVAAPDFEGWPEEPKLPKSAPLEDRIDWLVFMMFSQGFVKGMEAGTGGAV